MQRRILITFFAAILSTQFGCGTHGPSQIGSGKTVPEPRHTVPVPSPSIQPAPNGKDDQLLRGLLERVARTNYSVAGFTVRCSVYEKADAGIASQELYIAYKRPDSVFIHFLKSNTSSKDAKVLWKGGDEMRVRPGWLPFPVSLNIEDKDMLSVNGWSIRQTGPRAILEVLIDPQASHKALGTQTIEGRSYTMVDVRSGKSPAGITHEIIGVDNATLLPSYRAIYRGEALAYRIQAHSVSLSAPTDADMSL